jgi:hypothetical protein
LQDEDEPKDEPEDRRVRSRPAAAAAVAAIAPSGATWCGYDHGTGEAFRETNGIKEYSKTWLYDEKAQPHDVAKVLFKDGSIVEIAALTMADISSRAEARKAAAAAAGPLSRRSADRFWEAKHSKTDTLLRIRPRKDRQMLTMLYEDARMILGVKTALFAGDHQKATDFLRPIAEKFQRGELQSCDLNKCRDERLLELKIGMESATASASSSSKVVAKKQPALERPAAASSIDPALKRPAATSSDPAATSSDPAATSSIEFFKDAD